MPSPEMDAKLLEFEPPADGDAAEWAAAEKECLKFPSRLIKKAQELNECRQELKQAWEANERLEKKLFGFVVRNLITILDNCKLALADAAAQDPARSPATPDAAARDASGLTTDVPASVAPSSAAPAAAAVPANGSEATSPTKAASDTLASAGSLQAAALASACRSIEYVLEELGAARVELLGRTYDDVVMDGQKIDDPFEILEASQKGKASTLPVREVVADLWVLRSAGYVEVLQKGRVIC